MNISSTLFPNCLVLLKNKKGLNPITRALVQVHSVSSPPFNPPLHLPSIFEIWTVDDQVRGGVKLQSHSMAHLAFSRSLRRLF